MKLSAFVLSPFGLLMLSPLLHAQCTECEVDPNCTSPDGFPTLCPSSLPAGTAGEPYETFVSVYIPAEITDEGTGLVASLNMVTITSVTGLPPGMDLFFDDEDGVYEPASGQTSGCATLCGVPAFPGVFELQLGIFAVISALGFEQEITESFSLTLVVDPGSGGTSSFTFEPAAGCGQVLASFDATVFGEGNQITDHQWNLGLGGTASGPALDNVLFDVPGNQSITLETTILDQVLQQVQLFSTGGGGWDDFFGNPDPYFTLKDANDNVVYTSGTVDDSGSANWTGLNVVLNNPPYAIDFYDEDLFDGDDWLGWAPFSPNGAGTISVDANPSNAQLTIGLDPVVSVVDAAELIVYPLPEVDIVLDGADGLACSNDSLLQYTWSLSGLESGSGTEAFFIPEESGWFSVTALDSNGCSATSDSLLFCLPNASMPLDLIEANGIPMGLETSADHPWWAWSLNGALVDTVYSGGQVWFPLESGWYGVESISGLGCPLASDSLIVCWPMEAPQVSQDADGNLLVDGNYAGIQWWSDGVQLEGETDALLSNPGDGVYTVWVSDFIDCPGAQSDAWTYLSIDALSADRDVRVGPNPCVSQFILRFADHWKWSSVVLMDGKGNELQRRTALASPMIWDVESMPSGLLMLQIINEVRNESVILRLVRL